VQRCYFAVYRTLVAKQLATAHPEASIKMTGRWHHCKGLIRVICEKKWDKNYSQIMSLLSPPPASESGGSCPSGPMVAPPMGKGLVGYCTSGHSLNPPLLVSPIPLCVVSQTLDLENFARTSRSYCQQNSSTVELVDHSYNSRCAIVPWLDTHKFTARPSTVITISSICSGLL